MGDDVNRYMEILSSALTDREREVSRFRVQLQICLECPRCVGPIRFEGGIFYCSRPTCNEEFDFSTLIAMARKHGLGIPHDLTEKELFLI